MRLAVLPVLVRRARPGPLAAQRPLYIRWMQEIRRFKPCAVSWQFSVVAESYRTCVIDGLTSIFLDLGLVA